MSDHPENFTDLSQLKFYSIGIAVEDILYESEEEEKKKKQQAKTKPKTKDGKEEKEDPDKYIKLKVSPMEQLNVQKPGFMHHFKDEYVNIHPDERDKIVKDAITSKSYVEAIWSPFLNPNRVTPPTVRKNETVLLFKYGNVEKYFWSSIKHEPNIRKLERARWAFSNIAPDSGFEPYDKDTSYWFEVDTIDKMVRLKTNDNDGEKAWYDIKLNTKEGKLTVEDNNKNKLTWDTEKGELTIEFEKKIHLKAGEVIILDAPSVVISGGAKVGGGGVTSVGDVVGKVVRSTEPY